MPDLFTKLPKSGDADANTATATLEGIMSGELYVTMVILGNPPRVDDVITMAKDRAETASDRRCVVHAPSPEILDDALLAKLKGGEEPVSVSWGKNGVGKRLRLADALLEMEVEDAFAAAVA